MRIVVCDDHRVLLEALSHALAARGFTVEASTSSPAEAVAAVAEQLAVFLGARG